MIIGKETSSDKKEQDKKIDVKKLQSRRKELFRKRVRVKRPKKVFISTNSPATSTTLRTTSRFVSPIKTDPIVRVPATGSRARGILARTKPQAVRGVFVSRRPSVAKSNKPTIQSGRLDTSSIQQLQRQLQEQQQQLQRLQVGSPSQKDEGGGQRGRIPELPKDNASESTSRPNLRCRFFKDSC